MAYARASAGPPRPSSCSPVAPFRPLALVIVRVQLLGALRTEPVGELRVRVGADVSFQLIPVPVIIADLLARRTDGQQAAQGLDVGQSVLQLPNQHVPLFLRSLI